MLFRSLDAVKQHKQNTLGRFFDALLIPFYVFRLPASVYKKVGLFDERFGVGGGEDVDYRLRTLFAGISVKYTESSYILHFGGKSTWDGTETITDIDFRNSAYENEFITKWGMDLSNLCLSRGDVKSVIEKYQLQGLVNEGKFSEIIKRVYGQVS